MAGRAVLRSLEEFQICADRLVKGIHFIYLFEKYIVINLKI